jgi:hypothetical protein
VTKEKNMQTLWAIRHTTRSGSTWIDYTCIRSTRREAWREYERHNEGATPAYIKELARNRRKGITRAVKVTVQEVQHG